MSDANKYVVEKRVGDSDWEVVGTVEGVKTFRVSDLTPDTSYDFRVKGVNVIDGEEYSGEYSDVVSVRTLSSIDVAVPTGLSADMQWDRAVLTWDSVEGATGYELQYKSLNELVWVSLSRTDLLTQTVSSLSEGVRYSFRLRAVVVYGVYTFYSDWTEVVEDVTLVQVPSVPLNLAGDPYGDYVDVSWGMSSLATRYVLEFKVQDGQFSELYSGTDFSYRHSGLTVDTDYFYRVKAVREINGITSESDFTSEVQVNTGQIRLAIPSGFSLTSSDYTSAGFSWVTVSNAISYEISYLKGESDEFVVAGTFEGTTAKVSELSDGFSYKFRIRAVGEGDLFSDYSELLDVSLPLYELSVPSLPSVIPGSLTGGADMPNPFVQGVIGALYVSLGNASDVDFIQKVYLSLGLSEDSMEESEAIHKVEAGNLLVLIDIISFVENSNYFIKVRLWREVNSVDYYTDFSNILSFKTEYKLPEGLSQVNAVVDGVNVKLSWVYRSDDDISEGVLIQFRIKGDSGYSEWQDIGSYERSVLEYDYEAEPVTIYDFRFKTYRDLDTGRIYSDNFQYKSGVLTGSVTWDMVSLDSISVFSYLTLRMNLVKQVEPNIADGYYVMYDFNYANGDQSAIDVESYIDFKKYANFVDISSLVEMSNGDTIFDVTSSYMLMSYKVTRGYGVLLPFRYSDSIKFKSIRIDCGMLWDNSVTGNGVVFVIGKLLFKNNGEIVPLSITGSDLRYTGMYGGIPFVIDITKPVDDTSTLGELTDIFDMTNLDTRIVFDVGAGNQMSFTLTFDSEVSFSEVVLYPNTKYDGYTGMTIYNCLGNFSVRFFDASNTVIDGLDITIDSSYGTDRFKSIDFKGKTFGNYSNDVKFTIY